MARVMARKPTAASTQPAIRARPASRASDRRATGSSAAGEPIRGSVVERVMPSPEVAEVVGRTLRPDGGAGHRTGVASVLVPGAGPAVGRPDPGRVRGIPGDDAQREFRRLTSRHGGAPT